jgi:hypothetical protein
MRNSSIIEKPLRSLLTAQTPQHSEDSVLVQHPDAPAVRAHDRLGESRGWIEQDRRRAPPLAALHPLYRQDLIRPKCPCFSPFPVAEHNKARHRPGSSDAEQPVQRNTQPNLALQIHQTYKNSVGPPRNAVHGPESSDLSHDFGTNRQPFLAQPKDHEADPFFTRPSML